jgi:hypothetical protein
MHLHGERLGITQPELAHISTDVEAVNIANVKASDVDTRSKIDVANRLLAIETAQTTVRKVIEFHVVGNPNATEVDYEALRIPRPGPHPHLPAPDRAPGIRQITSVDMTIIASFFNALTAKPGKPAGVQAIEAYYKLGGDPPIDVSEMSERKQATASPLRIRFESKDEFQILYLAFRWVGTRGDFGPWTDIHKINIAR